ncbi:hypothetical protein [Neorhizobium galegae]|uniref:hypothetical protein n=1 Tax=Neorhizobium galegae TaxID=399 RepID=UPI001F35BDF2|nr:hypothetical protein [Neorhizobium galegae]UIK04891.1 hypothetical protein LZK81_19890 [Neorhizobium galegae]
MKDRLLRPDIVDCNGPREMASWLLTCPFSTMISEEAFIRRWLQMAGFREGLGYLDTILSIMREDRREDGNLLHIMSFSAANGRLWRVADGVTTDDEGRG